MTACAASAAKCFLQKNTDLIRKRLKDWKNASHLLKVHEDSLGAQYPHGNMKSVRGCFAKRLTIDKRELALAEAEK